MTMKRNFDAADLSRAASVAVVDAADLSQAAGIAIVGEVDVPAPPPAIAPSPTRSGVPIACVRER